jgi:hypothetical protein
MHHRHQLFTFIAILNLISSHLTPLTYTYVKHAMSSQTRAEAAAAAAEDVASEISTLDSRQFDNITIAQDDPLHQRGVPRKRRREREDLELWSHATSPPTGHPARGNSNQELLYCAKCKKRNSSVTNFRAHLRTKHGIFCDSTHAKQEVIEKANKLADGFKIQQDQWDKTKKTRSILREGINEADWLTVLALMVVNHNLPQQLSSGQSFTC